MHAVLRRIGESIEICPSAGPFKGKPIARAEKVSTRTGGRPLYGHPVTLKAVWGLEILDERIYDDPETMRTLPLSGRVR